jgi:AcrR family transcriptional regulator
MSPAATTSVEDARAAALRAAGELFYARGIVAVAMSDIRDASGVSMRRLYSLYPSKSALVAAWLQHRHDTWMAWFTTAVERHVAAGADPVLATFDAIAEWVVEPGYRGCAFINSLGESSELEPIHRTIIADHKRDLMEHLAQLVARNHPDAPSWFAAALAVIIDGAIVQSAIFSTTAPIVAARAAAQHLLEASHP